MPKVGQEGKILKKKLLLQYCSLVDVDHRENISVIDIDDVDLVENISVVDVDDVDHVENISVVDILMVNVEHCTFNGRCPSTWVKWLYIPDRIEPYSRMVSILPYGSLYGSLGGYTAP